MVFQSKLKSILRRFIMAESIYTQLENQSVTTPVDGKDYNHPLPDGLFPTAEIFENDEKLIAWANENKFTAKLIQKGLQKGIIEVRACFKSCKKDDVWSESYGLDNLAKMEWKSVDRPNQSGGKAIAAAKLEAGINMAQAMAKAGIDENMILASLTPVYGDDGASAIMKAITE
jgi:hypothetical protein